MSRVSKVETVFDLYVKGAKVWVTDDQEGWVAAVIERTSVDDAGAFQLSLLTETGRQFQTSASLKLISETKGADLPPLKNPPILEGIDDLTGLSYLHEPAVLHNIKTRYAQHNIYTYSGIVLIAVNPFQRVNLYAEDVIKAYCNKRRGELEPHLFAVAEDAFRSMVREKKDQSIIVSGESGAGKTVSAKYIMRYFATADDSGGHGTPVNGKPPSDTPLTSGTPNGTSSQPNGAPGKPMANGIKNHQQISEVEEQVLATNPIMESFGNAKTTRNDNSSRFGKYIEILFGSSSSIVGARIRTYLLERSRCVYQPETERNYHIFYQLCVGAPAAEKKELGLTSHKNFAYLNQGGGNGLIPGVDDGAEFELTQRALSTIGIPVSTQWKIFRLLAALLHLGNMEITKTGQSDAHIKEDDSALNMTCKLLEVDPLLFRKWLMKKRIVARTETVETNLSYSNSNMMRDSATKYVYASLFEWIVTKINESLCDDEVQAKSQRFIGVLDIYGFEHFKKNSFEQFCINYANEKLQQEFNQHVFKLEQEEYIREQIKWSFIDFNDNQPCIDLIEGKLGILALLDEESRLPSGSDKSLIDKLYNQFLENEKKGPNPRHSIAAKPPKPHSSGNTAVDPNTKRSAPSQYFSKPRFSQSAFVVHHFAYNVAYEIEGFLDKNRDTVSDELLEVLTASKSEFFGQVLASHKSSSSDSPQDDSASRRKNIMSVGSRAGLSGGRSRAVTKHTLGSVFKRSLQQLMETIHSTNVSYIRCIKPNAAKKPFVFDSLMVLSQLRACGVLETIRISTAGYPGRWAFDEFAERYYLLLPSDKWTNDIRDVCKAILTDTIKDSDKYQIGLSKIFFRAGQLAYLEKLRSDKLDRCVTLIQKNARRLIERKRYIRLKQYTIMVQSRWRGKTQRRDYEHMRQERAATRLQTTWRRYDARKKYLAIRNATMVIQNQWRVYTAQRKLAVLRQKDAALKIQAYWRGQLSRAQTQKEQRLIIFVQSCMRRKEARRILKQLKVEARSVNHFKEISYRLENKVVELTQTLATKENENKELMEKADYFESQLKFWKDKHEQAQANFRSASIRVKSSTSSKRELEALQTDMHGIESRLNAANDIIKARDADIAKRKDDQAKLREELHGLKEQLKEPRGMSPETATLINALTQQVADLKHQLAEASTAARQNEAQMRTGLNSLSPEGASISVTMHGHENGLHHTSHQDLVNPLSHADQYPPEARELAMRKFRRHSSAETWSKALKEKVMPAAAATTVKSPSTPGRERNDDEMLMEEEHTRALLQDKNLHDEITDRIIRNYKVPPMKDNVVTRKDVVFPSQILGILLIQLWRHGMAAQMQSVMTSAIKAIEDKCLRMEDDNTICFWLTNIYEIQSIIKSTKEERERSGLSVASQRHSKRQSVMGQPNASMDADRVATKVKNDLDYLLVDMFGNWLRSLRKRLSKLIIPALIENQSLPGFISKDPASTGFFKKLVQNPAFSIDDLLEFFSHVKKVTDFYFVDDVVIRQALGELLKTCGVTGFNHLIMRKNFCTWKRGMQIQYNASRIIEWCTQHHVSEGALHLERLMQAAKCLQLSKATPSNIDLFIEDLFDVCYLLSPTQIKKLMSIYTAGEYDNPIAPEVLTAVANRSSASEKTDSLFLEQTGEHDLTWFERPEPRRIGVIDKYMPGDVESAVPHVVLLLKFA